MNRILNCARLFPAIVILAVGLLTTASGQEAATEAAMGNEPTTQTVPAPAAAPADVPAPDLVIPDELKHDPTLPPEEQIRRYQERQRLLFESRIQKDEALARQRLETQQALDRERHSGPGAWFKDRALDLADFFRVRFHVPRGFRSVGLKVRATVLAQAGFIFFHGRSAGLDRRGVGQWKERRIEGGVGPLYFSKVKNEMISGNRFTDVDYAWSVLHERGIVRNGTFWDDGRYHPLSCGFELQLLFFGVEFEAYHLEPLDFIFGWVGFDPFQDDERRVLRRWDEILRIPELQVRDEWQVFVVDEPPKKEPAEAPPAETEAPAEPEKPKPEEEKLIEM